MFENKEMTCNYTFDNPFLALDYGSEFSNQGDQHTQGCRWSPDGKYILVACGNKEVKVFNLPVNIAKGEFNDENWLMGGWKSDIKPAFSFKESEYIYDYSWYPLMNSEDQNSSCFAVTCRGLPIHLWNSSLCQFVCSYSYFDHLEQLSPAHSIDFSLDGLKLVGGYSKGIRVFDVENPGKTSMPILCKEHTGIISALSFHPQLKSIFAAGSYSSSLALYTLQTHRAFAIFQGQKKGITHIKFSSDGTKLFSGTRNDDDIYCWDMRNPGNLLAVYKREQTSNQKFYFDITPQDDRFLITGTRAGQVLVWDLQSSNNDEHGDILPTTSFTAHKDCVNGISIHPHLPLLITSSGERRVPQVGVASSDESEDESPSTSKLKENSLKIWWISKF